MDNKYSISEKGIIQNEIWFTEKLILTIGVINIIFQIILLAILLIKL